MRQLNGGLFLTHNHLGSGIFVLTGVAAATKVPSIELHTYTPRITFV
jgi:hypothetical protein